MRNAPSLPAGGRKRPTAPSAACRPVGQSGSDGAPNRPCAQSRQGCSQDFSGAALVPVLVSQPWGSRPVAAWSGAIPTDWETRQPVEIRCGSAKHSSWMATPRCRIAVARYASMVELRREMHPRGHGCAMPLDRRAAGADRTRCAMRPIAGDMDVRYGRRRPRETSGTFAGHEGTEKASCIEAGNVVAFEVVAVAREASPAVRSRDTVTAAPYVTAGQLHRGALRSNASPNRLRRKTADRPAILTSYAGPGR